MTEALIRQLNDAIKNDQITEADVDELERHVIGREVGKKCTSGGGNNGGAVGYGNCGYYC